VSVIPSGLKIRCARNSSKRWPLTTSTMRPSELMPVWQYCHFVPGSYCIGFVANAVMRS